MSQLSEDHSETDETTNSFCVFLETYCGVEFCVARSRELSI